MPIMVVRVAGALMDQTLDVWHEWSATRRGAASAANVSNVTLIVINALGDVPSLRQTMAVPAATKVPFGPATPENCVPPTSKRSTPLPMANSCTSSSKSCSATYAQLSPLP